MACFSDLLALTVPSRLIIPVGSFIAGTLILTGSFSYAALLPLFALALADLASSVLNSLSDVKSDVVNVPVRPLARNALSTRLVTVFFLFLAACAVFFGWLISTVFLLVIFARLVLEFFYSTLQLKKVFLLNHALVGMTYGVVPLFAVCVFFGQPFPALFAYFSLLVIALSPLKDVPDIRGDRKTRVFTLPVIVGAGAAIMIVWLACVFLSSIFFFAGVLSLLPFVASLIFLSLFAAAYAALQSHDSKKSISRSLMVISSTLAGVIVEFLYVLR